jgi:hypothetical protein
MWPPKPEVEGATTDLRRSANPRGPRFFKEGRRTMFEFVLSSTSVIGPREATAADIAEHADAFAASGLKR